MYQFSRSLYRELAGELHPDPLGRSNDVRQRFLGTCEAAFDRLATDRDYFATPARTLFRDVRAHFPISSQLRVYQVIQSHMTVATEYVDRHIQAGITLEGTPLSCHATTRKGTACQREPVPGARYCPSHRHLEDFASSAA